jgi:CRP/FNR family transcriptional regulator, nitrogen fixation regulation protein
MPSYRFSDNAISAGSVADVSYGQGDAIYHQGDPAHCWFEVTRGMILTAHVSFDGRRQITGFHVPGEIFGAEHGRHKASAEVVSSTAKVRRVRWSAEDLGDGVFERALISAERSILLLGHRTAADRVAAFLRDLYVRTGVGGLVHLPMQRSDIADYLGLTPETVSRALTALVKRGLIAHAGLHAFRIFDRVGLEVVANGNEPRVGDEDVIVREDVHGTARDRIAI